MAPEDAESLYLLGAAYRRMGEANHAVAHLERCVAVDPSRDDAFTHLGLVRRSLNRPDAAFDAFQRAIEIDPRNVYAQAELINLETEAAGRVRIGASSRARRVTLHFNRRGQFAALKAVHRALAAEHWPTITGDGRALQEFGPRDVVIAGEYASAVRSLAAVERSSTCGPG